MTDEHPQTCAAWIQERRRCMLLDEHEGEHQYEPARAAELTKLISTLTVLRGLTPEQLHARYNALLDELAGVTRELNATVGEINRRCLLADSVERAPAPARVMVHGGTPEYNTCKRCGGTELELRNYNMMWHDGDLHCKKCGDFVRGYDAG